MLSHKALFAYDHQLFCARVPRIEFSYETIGPPAWNAVMIYPHLAAQRRWGWGGGASETETQRKLIVIITVKLKVAANPAFLTFCTGATEGADRALMLRYWGSGSSLSISVHCAGYEAFFPQGESIVL